MFQKELRAILSSTHGIHHSQYETLHIHPNRDGYSASFHNAVRGVELEALEKVLRTHPKLANYQLMVYRRDSNVIVRMQQAGKKPTVQLRTQYGTTARSYIKNEIKNLFNFDRSLYFNIDSYPAQKDWVVVYYACELDLQVFRDKLNASEYFGKYSIQMQNDNVYIRFKDIVIPEKYNKKSTKNVERKKVVDEPEHKTLTADGEQQTFVFEFPKTSQNQVENFVKSVFSNIGSYELNGEEIVKLSTMCSNAIANKTSDLDELNLIAEYIGKKIQIALV